MSPDHVAIEEDEGAVVGAKDQALAQADERAGEPLSDSLVDAQIGRLLEALAAAAGADLSLARLSKRSGLPMSTLRRFLIALDDAGLVRFTLGEDGRGTAGLTEQGCGLMMATMASPEGRPPEDGQ